MRPRPAGRYTPLETAVGLQTERLLNAAFSSGSVRTAYDRRVTQRSPWRLIITGVVILAIALAIRLFAGPLNRWLISMHGGGGGGH